MLHIRCFTLRRHARFAAAAAAGFTISTACCPRAPADGEDSAADVAEKSRMPHTPRQETGKDGPPPPSPPSHGCMRFGKADLISSIFPSRDDAFIEQGSALRLAQQIERQIEPYAMAKLLDAMAKLLAIAAITFVAHKVVVRLCCS
uniref:Uncharacterized protein n=1 Tax=Prymnesium polylepis TaxID=72548 RepID=A0A6T7XPE9_9EUKA|mmetsp:Transcript_16429/g.41604  ORF Transcript_16429/g.41604 Transcript_16429/m.41604 type:complete len:146 (+) Transcript_16429:49-486(+)